ncbi:13583_t:CDS:1, partial [Entrophospora sp. SA101]
ENTLILENVSHEAPRNRSPISSSIYALPIGNLQQPSHVDRGRSLSPYPPLISKCPTSIEDFFNRTEKTPSAFCSNEVTHLRLSRHALTEDKIISPLK